MDAQQAATSGIEALNIRNEPGETVSYMRASQDDATFQDASSRKRQKVTHLTTTPLFADPQLSQTLQTASSTLAGFHAEPVGTGEFDYLLHWQHSDHDVVEDDDLIIADDEEDEEVSEEQEEDDADGGHQEDIDMLSVASGKSKLTKDQIVDIINESISYYTSAWKPNKDVLKGDEINDDPEEMWLSAERAGHRHEFVERYKVDVAYYTQRLNRLCDEILRAPGSSAKDVKKQCCNLEMTVDYLELSQWLLSIYVLETSDVEAEDSHLSDSQGGRPEPQTPHRNMANIIDLGSPPDSSDDQVDGVLVESSPQPELPTSRRLYTPDSVIGESLAADSVVPESTTADSVIPDSVIVGTIEAPAAPQIGAGALSDVGARNASQSQTVQKTLGRIRASAPAPPVRKPQARYGDEPEQASIVSARRWKWEDLRNTEDRKRIATKAVLEMKSIDRETIRQRLETVSKVDIIREVPACVEMLAKNEIRMHGVLPRDLPKIVIFTRLFLCWWLCDNYFRAEPSNWDLDELQKCLQEKSPDPSAFYDYLHKIMSTTFSTEALRHPERPSQVEIIEISDDEEPPSQPSQLQRKSQIARARPSQSSTMIVLD
ncbi:hypothetical protein IQ06DRAFT_298344 [Phaeosphaeriaceae sp. SRC1lsM3a]|nr:hypothetical protein IQ06DRAFT_298344 [Stagonospora sp. SRC1lsM3a]